MADKKNIKLMVEGGKANAGPPLGPTLAPLKMNIQEIVEKINEKTKEFKGITVPVELSFDPSDKSYEITVGSPSVSQLIKKEMGLEKLAQAAWYVPEDKPVADTLPAPVAAAPVAEKKEGETPAPAAPVAVEKEVKKIEKFDGSIEFSKIIKIAKMKKDSIGNESLKSVVKQVVGTCQSCGVSIDNKRPAEVMKEIVSGNLDSLINE